MGKLINRIPGSRLLISSLPGSAMSTSVLKALPGKLDIKRHSPSILYVYNLGPSINGLVTDGNTKLCCQGFILALFQSTTANTIDSEHTHDYQSLLPYAKLK